MYKGNRVISSDESRDNLLFEKSVLSSLTNVSNISGIQNSKLAKSFFEFFTSSFNMAMSFFIDILPISFTYLLLRSRNDELLLSTFGFGLSYFNLTFAFLYGFSEYFGVQGSKCVGSKNYKRFTLIFFKTTMAMYFLSILSIILIIKSNYIMEMCGISKDLRDNTSYFLRINLVERILDIGLTLFRTILICQNFHHIFLPINIINLVVFISTSYFTISVLKLDLEGYAISRFIKTTLEFVLLFIYFKKHSNREMIYLPSIKSIFKNIFKTFKTAIITLLAVWGEVLSLELTSLLIAGLNDLIRTAAWVSFMNILFYNLFFSLGMSNTFRTNIGIIRGTKNVKLMFEFIKLYFTYAYSIGLAFSFIFYFSAEYISLLFTENKEVIYFMTSYLKIYSFFLCFFLTRNCWNTVLRIMDYQNIQFLIGGVLFPIVILVLSVLSIYVFDFGVYGVLYSFLFSDFIVNLIMTYIYVRSQEEFTIRMKDNLNVSSFENYV